MFCFQWLWVETYRNQCEDVGGIKPQVPSHGSAAHVFLAQGLGTCCSLKVPPSIPPPIPSVNQPFQGSWWPHGSTLHQHDRMDGAQSDRGKHLQAGGWIHHVSRDARKGIELPWTATGPMCCKFEDVWSVFRKIGWSWFRTLEILETVWQKTPEFATQNAGRTNVLLQI